MSIYCMITGIPVFSCLGSHQRCHVQLQNSAESCNDRKTFATSFVAIKSQVIVYSSTTTTGHSCRIITHEASSGGTEKNCFSKATIEYTEQLTIYPKSWTLLYPLARVPQKKTACCTQPLLIGVLSTIYWSLVGWCLAPRVQQPESIIDYSPLRDY